jgi:hypothetical protein
MDAMLPFNRIWSEKHTTPDFSSSPGLKETLHEDNLALR